MNKLTKAILCLLPMLLGSIGLIGLEHEPFLDAMFKAFQMYFINYSDTPTNVLIEIARWTAPLVTASGIIAAFKSLKEKFHNYKTLLGGNSVAVYGNGDTKDNLLGQLGSHGIDLEDGFAAAGSYILAGSERYNLEFYGRHKEKLAGRKVYLKSMSMNVQASPDANVTLFCEEETAARVYWLKHPLFEKSMEKGHKLSVVFLGFGKLGEEMLIHGLQTNIFDPDQKITYHIFGETEKFQAVYHNLSQLSDEVVFYKESWYEKQDVIEESDLVLILQQDGQEELISDFLFAVKKTEACVFAAESTLPSFLSSQSRISFYCWHDEGLDISNIMDGYLLEKAKRINHRYACLYSGAENTEETKEASWKSLDAFTRYSNISSADYHEMRMYMLKTLNMSLECDKFTPPEMEQLSHLEHIRWCRYHYLNNWSYGVPENGDNKDKVMRIHCDLVDYNTLTDEEKEKDRENIRVLMSVR